MAFSSLGWSQLIHHNANFWMKGWKIKSSCLCPLHWVKPQSQTPWERLLILTIIKMEVILPGSQLVPLPPLQNLWCPKLWTWCSVSSSSFSLVNFVLGAFLFMLILLLQHYTFVQCCPICNSYRQSDNKCSIHSRFSVNCFFYGFPLEKIIHLWLRSLMLGLCPKFC